MIIHTELETLSCPGKTAVALGTFDGLHTGHQAVIKQVTASFREPTVLTVLPTARRDTLLMLPAEKEALLQAMGVKRYIPAPLAQISHLSAEAFFYTYLMERLQAAEIACGFNFRFGKDAAGDTALLSALCRKNHVRLTVVDAVLQNRSPVSSSRIRTALKQGDPSLAAALLGRPFGFAATIVEGQRLGHTLGFPTVNQTLPEPLLIPRLGVYAVLITLEEKRYAGVCNIGVHPTVGNAAAPLAETYILNYRGNAYGKTADLRLLSYLRPEKVFASLDDLKAAIEANARQAQEIAAPYLSQ